MQIWWLIICTYWEGEKVEACILQKSRSYRRQIAWLELGPALSVEKWFNNCGDMLLPFAWLFKASGVDIDMTPDHSGKGTMDVQGEATE